MFQEAVERFHQLDHSDVRTIIDKLVIGVGGIGPAPGVGEGVELRLTYLSGRFTKQNVVIGVGIKRRIEIDKIDARVGKFLPIRKPFQIVAKIAAVPCFTVFTRYWADRPTSRDVSHNESSRSRLAGAEDVTAAVSAALWVSQAARLPPQGFIPAANHRWVIVEEPVRPSRRSK